MNNCFKVVCINNFTSEISLTLNKIYTVDKIFKFNKHESSYSLVDDIGSLNVYSTKRFTLYNKVNKLKKLIKGSTK